MITNLFNGYLSLIREFFSRKNDQEFLALDQKVYVSILILGSIGLIRNTVSALAARIWFSGVRFDVWFALDLEISNVMFWFPVFLAFFGAMVVHLVARVLGQELPYRQLFSCLFYLQAAHLAVLLIDALFCPVLTPILPYKLWFGRNWWPYFSSGSTMSYGIVGAWLIAGYLLFKVLVKYFRVGPGRAGLIMLISFNILYWPIYHLFSLYNFLFAHFAHSWCGLQVGSRQYWGYGLFFLAAGGLGIIYHWFQFRKLVRLRQQSAPKWAR